VLRCQALRIISEVTNAPDTEPQVRLDLRRHLDANPGRPERALLAHLRDWRAREGLEGNGRLGLLLTGVR
jgi:hypothetical protein